MSYQYDEEEFKQTGAGWWIRLLGVIVYMLVIVAYALQTLELVSWLFPDSNWFMKVVTVFVCDGCATGYAMAEMFYRFRLRRSKHLTFGMWIITFILSTAASVIQMYLSSTGNIPHKIDPAIIAGAYGLIIVAFVINIIAITVIIRMEYGAAQPAYRYLDDRPKKVAPQRLAQPTTRVAEVSEPSLTDKVKQLFGAGETTPEPAQLANTASVPAPKNVLDALTSAGFDVNEVLAALQAKQGAQQADPQTAPLTDQANQ